ncbi:hypothetical protein [Phytohabitans suffuscus]|uniref:hypothetical protein n=1 Tax=Phytohabitans suffuscus TaxID=624315 RepID=UPI001566A167|nr:hypothetical protein [Phytohabitans suffuscus]
MSGDYSSELAAALRKRNVSGLQIGDAIAEVETHVAASGQPPTEAFGPAEQYADAVVAALGPARPIPIFLGVTTYQPAGPLAKRAPLRSLREPSIATALAVGCFLVTSVLINIIVPGNGFDVGWLIASAASTSLALGVVGLALARGRSTPGLRIVAVGTQAALFIASVILVLRRTAFPWWLIPTFGVLLVGAAVQIAGEWRDRVIDPRAGTDRYPVPTWAFVVAVIVLAAPIGAAVALRLWVQ